MDEMTDDDLMRLYQQGDADAFDVLFDRYYVSVYNFARSVLGNGVEADEILQETFLAVARSAASYVGRGKFRAWLMRIVRNRCLNQLAAVRARREVLGDRDCEAGAWAAGGPGPVEQLEELEEEQRIRAAMAELPERQREAIALYAFEQMKYREIAEVMEMPEGTVKTLIHRARASLAQRLTFDRD